MNKKNIFFILIVTFVFLILFPHLEFTGLTIYRVPLNIEIDILNEDKEVKAGETLEANLIFYNLLNPKSILFNYSVQSMTGEILITKQENLFIEKETILKRNIKIPKTAETGYYFLTVNWDDSKSKTSSIFKVISTSHIFKFSLIKILTSIILMLGTLLIIIFILTHNTVLDELTKLDKAKISLFFWRIGWALKQHNYFIKYIIAFIILSLLGIILILINY